MTRWKEPVVRDLTVRRDTGNGEIEHISVEVSRSQRSSCGTVTYEVGFEVHDHAAAWKQIEERHPPKGSDGTFYVHHLAVLFEAARPAVLNVPGVERVEAFGRDFDGSPATADEPADDVDRGEGALADGGERA